MDFARYYFKDVPRLGNVAVSRHAQARAEEEQISEDLFIKVLLEGQDTPDGLSVIFREIGQVRLVINKRPTPFRGACLVTTVFRIKAAV
jgi:hypothetical protein